MPNGWAAPAGGLPAMAGNVPFLMKDVVFLCWVSQFEAGRRESVTFRQALMTELWALGTASAASSSFFSEVSLQDTSAPGISNDDDASGRRFCRRARIEV
jgi:hypothetical protein